MKTQKFLTLAVAAACLNTFALTASASDFEVGAGVTYYGFDKEASVDDKAGFNLNMGYRFNKPFGIELSYSQVNTDLDPSGADVKLQDIHLDGLWYLANDGKVLPYAALGIGTLDADIDGFESDSEEAVNFGLGVKAHLTSFLRARLDARWLYGTDTYQDHSALTLGLSYVFGGTKPTPAVVFMDADKDGVEDSGDKCPNTPAGVAVTANGCPVDSDKDGVADYLDQCPDTDSKLKVDEKGCPVVLTEDVSIKLNVTFASGSDVVEPNFFEEIRGVGRFMEQYENSQVVIEGHTDTSGSAELNKKLSQKRANAVAKILVEQYGVAADRVQAVGFGEEQVLVKEVTAADKAQNRRVIAKVSAKKEVMEKK